MNSENICDLIELIDLINLGQNDITINTTVVINGSSTPPLPEPNCLEEATNASNRVINSICDIYENNWSIGENVLYVSVEEITRNLTCVGEELNSYISLPYNNNISWSEIEKNKATQYNI